MTHQRFRWLVASLIALIWLSSGTGIKPLHKPLYAQSDPASEIFRLINEFRVSRGLTPFQYNPLLATAAQRHAEWMAANVIYSHTGAGGSSPVSRAANAGFNGYVVENIVGGSNMSPRQGLIWWQNSPIHLNTLVSTRYPNAGVGFATNGTQNMFVLVVGRLSSDSSAVRPNAPADRSAEPLIITPIELSEPREDGAIVHVMQQGQAMWTIAAYYDVDLDFLYLINGLTEKDILHPGNEVFVQLPEGQDPPPTPTPPLSVVVEDGESAWIIAGRYGISVDYLYLLNNLDPRTVLQPGDELVIRLAEGQAPPPTPTPIVMHTIRSGDSAWNIAAQYGLSLDELLSLNSMTADSILSPGAQLRVRFPTPTPTAAPSPTQGSVSESIAAAAPVDVAVQPETTPAPSPQPQRQNTSELAVPLQAPETESATPSPLLLLGLVLAILIGSSAVVYRRKQKATL